jgi:hypothetical protein
MTLADAPEISGIKLAMPITDLANVVGPKIKFKPAKNGTGSFFQNFVEQAPPPKLTGTRAMYVRYFNGRVYQIEIFFEDKDKPSKLKEFTDRLSTYYELPREAWIAKNGRAELDCGTFRVSADAVLNRHIELTDVAAYKEFQETTKIPQRKIRIRHSALPDRWRSRLVELERFAVGQDVNNAGAFGF